MIIYIQAWPLFRNEVCFSYHMTQNRPPSYTRNLNSLILALDKHTFHWSNNHEVDMSWDMVSALAKLLEVIVWSYMQGNVGSTNVLNKLGFKERGSGFWGEVRKSMPRREQWVGVLSFVASARCSIFLVLGLLLFWLKERMLASPAFH